jgi:hypothetical protein
MSPDQILALLTIITIAAAAWREPEMIFLPGWRPERGEKPLSLADAEQIRTLQRHAVAARADRRQYTGRHRVLSQAEYRSGLAAIGQPEPERRPEPAPDKYAALYRPWKPGW